MIIVILIFMIVLVYVMVNLLFRHIGMMMMEAKIRATNFLIAVSKRAGY